MKELRIKLHSMTDLITNSSTVIYTYSDASLGACRDMIDEVFRVLGVDKKCDDVFTLFITSDVESYDICDTEPTDDTPKEFIDNDGQFIDDKVSELLDQIHNGQTPPEWLNKIVSKIDDRRDYPTENTLIVKAKSPEFEKLADLIKAFLYSTSHEATRDG